ncbi:MAG TPA: hypothetical protein VLZ75_00240 [Chitinophagales bacterium]|nr:hypothetical protein [Chitinophagales bacterium]
MLKDINFTRNESIAIAIAKNHVEDDMWIAYLLNLGDVDLNTVMVSSRGYGDMNGIHKETATLRWMLDDIPAQSICVIEEIPDDVIQLNNEFLVSFFCGNQLFDKKIIFLSESCTEEFMTDIPLLKKRGVLIR